ncbi:MULTISPECIES: hypothetical protein [unclassified Rathayibacter]|uniref:hypothetical protein n=1 Tax=unclassified Rathayibacter TaxID=2609250 RepID=UPI002157F01C|nr:MULTISPECIES: hypothetical protein [unclassified Rathayibacter]
MSIEHEVAPPSESEPAIETEVWIVQHEESPHNTVLGVFGSPADADLFADEVKDSYRNGVLIGRFPIGYRSTGNVSRYSSLK